MKYLLPILFATVIFSCGVKKETKTISKDNNSVSSKGTDKAASGDLDTAYVENPVTGNIQMIVTKKTTSISQESMNINSLPPAKSGDTVYVEDPKTGDIQMIIVD